LNARGADIRHTSHGSPQTTPKYGKAAPVWVAVPIIGVCSFFSWWWLWDYWAICLGKRTSTKSVCKSSKFLWEFNQKWKKNAI